MGSSTCSVCTASPERISAMFPIMRISFSGENPMNEYRSHCTPLLTLSKIKEFLLFFANAV